MFVIGADRSGASVLAWAIGQHPRIPAVIDAEWLGGFARELPVIHGRAFGDGAGRTRPLGTERFSRTFGRAAAALVGDSLERWVDCAPEHTGNAVWLAQLFPEAQFIHVVRDADAAIGSLVDPPLGSAAATGGTQIPAHLRIRLGEREASERWMSSVLASVGAEEQLGADRVMRVAYSELIERPEVVLRRSLEFVREPFAAECLRPLQGLRPALDGSANGSGGPLRATARALSAELLGRPRPAAEEADEAEEDAPHEPAAEAPPRVVMVTDHFPKFSETFFVNKFVALRERGWDVHVVCNRSNEDQWKYFPGLREQPDVAARLHVTKDFEVTLAELGPALVHFGYGTLALGRMHVAATAGRRTIVSFRGYDVNYHGLEDEHAYADVWRSADMLHFVGEDTWRRAQRRGCPPDKAHVVITDAVDVSGFEPPRRGREKVGTKDRPLRLLSVGRLHWKKGHEFGLRAVRELVDAGIDVSYRIIGEGPHREATLFAIHDLELEQHVELCGAKSASEVRESLAWADVFLHPAVSEGFCVSAIEAQAMELPVVCSDADGLSENIADGKTGFVVPRRDSEQLAARLRRLAEDGALRRRLGRAARQRALEHFDATAQVDRFEALYRELLESPRPEPATAGPTDEREQLLDSLERELHATEDRAARLRREVFGREVVQRVKAFAEQWLPAGARVLVVSRGDERLVDLAACRAGHFPQGSAGEYAGYHPADSAAAIAHLDELAARGAEFLIVPATSNWWLEHYKEFTDHLDTRFRRVAEEADGHVTFALAERELEGAGQTTKPEVQAA
jgi:colanic acid/amylovoran biosynthesis glycosyltransferase